MGSAAAAGGGSTGRDRRDDEADARDEAADDRERRDDARERVLDRWERELTDRAVSLHVLDDREEDERARARQRRATEHAARRADAETRRDAAIERDIDRTTRPGVSDDDALADLTSGLIRLAGAVDDDRPLGEVLDLLGALVVECIPGASAATVCLTVDGQLVPAVSTAPWAGDLDAAQVRTGQGPVVLSVETGALVVTDDLGTDDRWRLGDGAGIDAHRAAITVPIVTDRTSPGAVTAYSHPATTFDRRARLMLTALSTGAALAIGRGLDHLAHQSQTQAWERALHSRDDIGQAKGVLMAVQRLTADQAFDLLRSTSQRMNVKVRDVAGHVVRHHSLPAPDHPPSPRS